MDFLKFVGLLEGRALWFLSLDKLEDPREGRLTPRTKELLLRREQGDGDRMLHAYQEVWRPAMLVNCWHASKTESAAMWKLYSPRGYGIAIRSSIVRLKRGLASAQGPVMIGKVKYVDTNRFCHTDIPNALTLCLVKDRSFAHEREVRLVRSMLLDKTPGTANGQSDSSAHGQANLPSGMPVAVNVAVVMKEVLVDPNAESWVRDLVERSLVHFGIRRVVRQSDLFRLPN
jgi:hypothetical protein